VTRARRDRRTQRDLHALNADGMLVCNPRDREAAHRAQVEGIATEDAAAVTCAKCRRMTPPERILALAKASLSDLTERDVMLVTRKVGSRR